MTAVCRYQPFRRVAQAFLAAARRLRVLAAFCPGVIAFPLSPSCFPATGAWLKTPREGTIQFAQDGLGDIADLRHDDDGDA